jgi:hypothetical protein
MVVQSRIYKSYIAFDIRGRLSTPPIRAKSNHTKTRGKLIWPTLSMLWQSSELLIGRLPCRNSANAGERGFCSRPRCRALYPSATIGALSGWSVLNGRFISEVAKPHGRGAKRKHRWRLLVERLVDGRGAAGMMLDSVTGLTLKDRMRFRFSATPSPAR